MKILSQIDINSTSYRVRIKANSKKSALYAMHSLNYTCNCYHDCCSHVNITAWNYTFKHDKRKEYTFEVSYYYNHK